MIPAEATRPPDASNWADSIAPRWPAISTLLDEALAMAVVEREAWLAALDGDRAAHRDVLRSLLAVQASVETEDFLGVLPQLPEARRGATDGLSTGQQVGPYRLIALLGRGGMGTVWLAERVDAMTKRRVALKLPHAVWGDAFVERLAREREILATLEHEHIARLYDAGVDARGRPFLAMEYVEGEAIDVWCRVRDLPLEARIDLLLQVMSAVAHAHAMLVVHRDLKPNNILVTAEGRVRLLDFGVAKLLEGDRTQETALTEFSGRALTLDYASPEQIRGDPLGTASDIYSMAIVAFELLAGERPYLPGSIPRMAGHDGSIAAPEAPLASARARDRRTAERLRGDLDAILGKATKTVPADRYPTMDAFAQDLRRHLAGEPVEARPDRFSERATRFVRRHRVQVTAGATVVLALVIGLTVALWQAREARDQARIAKSEATTAQAVQGFLEGVFSANTISQSDPAGARETTARQLLDRGAERIETELHEAPEARLHLLGILGDMYEQMQIPDRHIALRRQARAQAEALYGPSADETVLSSVTLAHALTLDNQFAEAIGLLQQADAILTAERDPAPFVRYRVDVMLASLERRTDPSHGLIVAERALAFARTRGPDDELLLALRVMGDNADFTGASAKARDAYAEIVHISEAHPPLGAGELSLTYGSLGQMRAKLGDIAGAEADIRKGLGLERARNADPVILYQTELQSAWFFHDTGRDREALDIAEDAWLWARRTPDRAEARWIRRVYGDILETYGRVDDVLDATADVTATGMEPTKMSRVELGTLNLRTRALIRARRLPEARTLLDATRALVQQSNGRLSPEASDGNERLWLMSSGRGRDALTAWNAARAAAGLPAEPDTASSVREETDYAAVALAAGELAVAESHASTALRKIAASGQEAYRRDVAARAQLIRGKALLQQGRTSDACPVIAQALQLHRLVFDPERSPDVADAARTYARCPRVAG